MLGFNLILGLLLLLVSDGAENPNNQSVMNVYVQDMGSMKAAVIFLAPVVEAMMFRAGIFGVLRSRCYERTNSIWCSIFFHMLVNGISLSALGAIG